jgi:NAD(P)H dehydrogenase (quinone)
MKKILIINGHPNAESFSFGIAEAYKKGALSAGAEVQEIVIRDLKFNPRSNPGASKKAVPTQMPVWIIVVPPNIWTIDIIKVSLVVFTVVLTVFSR